MAVSQGKSWWIGWMGITYPTHQPNSRSFGGSTWKHLVLNCHGENSLVECWASNLNRVSELCSWLHRMFYCLWWRQKGVSPSTPRPKKNSTPLRMAASFFSARTHACLAVCYKFGNLFSYPEEEDESGISWKNMRQLVLHTRQVEIHAESIGKFFRRNQALTIFDNSGLVRERLHSSQPIGLAWIWRMHGGQ